MIARTMGIVWRDSKRHGGQQQATCQRRSQGYCGWRIHTRCFRVFRNSVIVKISCICSLEHSTWSAPFANCTSSIIQLVCPPKFCMAFAFNFLWVSQTKRFWRQWLSKMLRKQTGRILGDLQMGNVCWPSRCPPNDPKNLYGRKSYPVFYSFSKWQIVTVFPQQLSLLDHAYLKVKLNFSKQRTSKMEFSPAH